MRTLAALLLLAAPCFADTDEDVRIAMAMATAVKPSPLETVKPIRFDLSALSKPARAVSAKPFRSGVYNADHTCPNCRISYSEIALFDHDARNGTHWHKCPSCGAKWWHYDGPGTSIRN